LIKENIALYINKTLSDIEEESADVLDDQIDELHRRQSQVHNTPINGEKEIKSYLINSDKKVTMPKNKKSSSILNTSWENLYNFNESIEDLYPK